MAWSGRWLISEKRFKMPDLRFLIPSPAVSLHRVLLMGLIWLGALTCTQETAAQVTEAQARMLLAERGIPEDTLRARLMDRGINPDSINPDSMVLFQEEVLAVIREIEAEKANQQIQTKDSIVLKKAAKDTVQVVQKPVDPEKIPESMTVDSTDLPLPVYGQSIFTNKAIDVFQRAEDMVAPDEYVLGPGDKLGVVGFGRSQFNHILDLGADGFVKPDGMGRILLKGLTLREARSLLFQRYSQAYLITRDQFQVTVQQARLMTINVFGEVEVPGSYTMPAINTAFNALAAAGGPTALGSVREIRIIRGNQTIPVDVYSFMANPRSAKDYFLQQNDYIHVPVARKVVEVRGAVTRPMKYELLEGENLDALIGYAGGPKANAYLSDVQVTRYLQDRRVVAGVNYRELLASGGDYVLYNGDVITVREVRDEVDNTVTIEGAVSFPGEYAWRDDLRLLDLLQQSVLKPEARLDFAYLLRYNTDGTFRYANADLAAAMADPAGPSNPVLGRGDRVEVLSQKLFASRAQFSVTGSVRNPRYFDFDPDGGVRVSDALQMAGGLLPDAADAGYIFRRDPSEPKTVEYIPVDLHAISSSPGTAGDFQIRSGDQLRVFNKALRRDDLKVSIFGSVRRPGEYDYGKDMTLADLVSLAGGFTFDADYSRIDVARPDYKPGQSLKIKLVTTSLSGGVAPTAGQDQSLTLAPFDHIYVRSIPEYALQQTVKIEGEVKYPGTYAILKDKERLSDVIARAGGLNGRAFPEGARMYRMSDSVGLVVIDLVEVLRNPGSPSNIVLLDGDVIEIPKSRDLVTLTGYINLDEAYSEDFLTGERSISVAFRGVRSAKYYIDEFAAGISDRGARNRVRVQYADGRVKQSEGFLFHRYPKVERGSTVFVGAKAPKQAKPKSERKADWAVVLRDTLAATTSIITILVLVDQLSK